MTTEITVKKQREIFSILLEEVRIIRKQLEKFLLLIPEESLKEYKNSSQIKKAYLEVTKNFNFDLYKKCSNKFIKFIKKYLKIKK